MGAPLFGQGVVVWFTEAFWGKVGRGFGGLYLFACFGSSRESEIEDYLRKWRAQERYWQNPFANTFFSWSHVVLDCNFNSLLFLQLYRKKLRCSLYFVAFGILHIIPMSLCPWDTSPSGQMLLNKVLLCLLEKEWVYTSKGEVYKEPESQRRKLYLHQP